MSSGPQTRGKVLDYREYLTYQLGEIRTRIKWMDVGAGAVILTVGAILYVLSIIVADQIFVLSGWSRLGLLAVFMAATLFYLWRSVLSPAAKRINIAYAAREAERASPGAKNSILNWLLLTDRQKESLPEPILKAIETRAANDLRRIDVHEAIHSVHLLRASIVLLAARCPPADRGPAAATSPATSA